MQSTHRSPYRRPLTALLLAAGGSLALAGAANAAWTPTLDTVTAVGPVYEFSYSATVSGDTGLTSGDQLVIFDFQGYVPGSISAGIYAADIDVSVENTSALLPPPNRNDDPSVLNLVFTWTGNPFNASGGPFADVSFSGLTARSIFSGVNLDGYSASTTINNLAATGQPEYNQGSVGVPLFADGGGSGGGGPIPEPGAWALMILGFGGAGAMLRRRSQAPAAT